MNDKARRELEREASYLRFLLCVGLGRPRLTHPLRNALARLESDLRVESGTDSSTNSGRVRKWRRLIPWARPKR
jgi:hypothetical protein